MTRPWTRAALCIVVAVVLGACAALGERSTDPDLVRLTLLQINDHYVLEPVDGGRRGGMARLATLVREVRRENPNPLFVLAGATLSPSVESTFLQGAQMIAALNAIGLDLATFGNHEFDFGPSVLAERMKESKFRWLSANVVARRSSLPFGGASTDVLLTLGGARVGFFGLTTAETAQTSRPGARSPGGRGRPDVDHEGRIRRALPGPGRPVADARGPTRGAVVALSRGEPANSFRPRGRGAGQRVRQAVRPRARHGRWPYDGSARSPHEQAPHPGNQSRQPRGRPRPRAARGRRGPRERRRDPHQPDRVGGTPDQARRPHDPALRRGGIEARDARTRPPRGARAPAGPGRTGRRWRSSALRGLAPGRRPGAHL